jgi:hypothetical protein
MTWADDSAVQDAPPDRTGSPEQIPLALNTEVCPMPIERCVQRIKLPGVHLLSEPV